MKHKENPIRLYIFVTLLLAVLIYTIFFLDAQMLVETIGVSNSYIVMFILTVVTGMSTFSSGLIYSSMFAFLKGGTNPLILGIVAGVGAIIGDIFFYYVFSKGHQSFSEKRKKKIRRIMEWFDNKDERIVPFFIVIWIFLPLPNDMILVSLLFFQTFV
jgi:uncharacterized membrane protein YdjX (TVP38/TMEM64 family)